MKDDNENRLNYLKYLFEFPKEFNINKDNINYIYFKIPKWCCTYTPNAMFDNIKPFGWNQMKKKLNESNNNFISDIEDYPEKTMNIKLDDYEQNELILNYIKCRPNIKILTQFSNKKLDFKNCNLYATKEIELSNNAIEVLIYEMFCLTPKFKEYKKIKDYVKLLKNNKIKIYVYEEIEDKKIDHNIDMTCDFISPDFITTINIAELYFNKNSLNHMNEMLLERFLDKDFNRTRILLNTFKKMLLVRKVTLLEQTKFMLLSGSVLATYGIRKSKDIDAWISNDPESVDDSVLSKTQDLLLKETEKLFFLDIYHPKVNWQDYWKEHHKEWASKFGANNMLDCIHNPRFHYYFCGIKFLILDADIEKRQLRGRPASVTDLIMINRLLNKNIKLNPINIIGNKHGGTNEVYNINPIKFIKTVHFWLKKKYNTKISKKEEASIIFI